ncbi:regulatory protein [Oribacterium sp. KHPX15]|uniref:regulatory protein RecX n=1 Tax=unclassified Oribacterium TaxID=2629782 RepID=UPI000897DFD3|nr:MULTISPECIES: regulatory protein RecX [unclassified Oribacterium]SEA12514.1 regulatory protein [Oribacterium sp. KHPX15]
MKTIDDLLKEHGGEVSGYNLDPDKMSEHDKLLNRCKERSLYLLEQAAKPESKLREKLVKSGRYSEEIIEETMDFLKKYDYINDLRFAKQLIKHYSGSKSLREIEQKLYQRGVNQKDIKEAMAEFKDDELSEGAEMRAVKAAIYKKCKDPSALDAEQKRKLYASLMRKGFSYSTVRNALSIEEDY